MDVFRRCRVKSECPREGVYDFRGRMGDTALLDSQVILDADARQQGQLLTPQTRNASPRPSCQPNIFGANLPAPRTQVFTQRAGHPCHLPDGNTVAARRRWDGPAVTQDWIDSFEDMASLDAQFDEAKIATGQLRDIAEFCHTEWAQQWGVMREVPDRAGGTITIPGPPWHFSLHDGSMAPQVPALQGEHNRELLKELGYDDEPSDSSRAAPSWSPAGQAKPIPQEASHALGDLSFAV
jgi:CoA-transferase family III